MKIHGLRKHPLYSVWHNIKKRCEYHKHHNYKNYGGRGIQICERWKIFKNFYDDNIQFWQNGFTIERVDVNGHYEPSNCKWIESGKQAWNKRTPIRNLPTGVYFNGSRFTARIGIKNRLVYLGAFDTAEQAGEAYQKAKRARNSFD